MKRLTHYRHLIKFYSQGKGFNAKFDGKKTEKMALLELLNFLCININNTKIIEYLRLNSLQLQTHTYTNAT